MSKQELQSQKIKGSTTAYTYLNSKDIIFALELKELHKNGKVLFVVTDKGKLLHAVYLPNDRGIMNIEGEAKVFEGTGIKNIPYSTTAPYYPSDVELVREIKSRNLIYPPKEKVALREYILNVWNKKVNLIQRSE